MWDLTAVALSGLIEAVVRSTEVNRIQVVPEHTRLRASQRPPNCPGRLGDFEADGRLVTSLTTGSVRVHLLGDRACSVRASWPCAEIENERPQHGKEVNARVVEKPLVFHCK